MVSGAGLKRTHSVDTEKNVLETLPNVDKNTIDDCTFSDVLSFSIKHDVNRYFDIIDKYRSATTAEEFSKLVTVIAWIRTHGESNLKTLKALCETPAMNMLF